MSDEVFAQLVHGISGYVAQAALGQQPTDTISDFLTNLGQSYNIPQGEGACPNNYFNNLLSD